MMIQRQKKPHAQIMEAVIVEVAHVSRDSMDQPVKVRQKFCQIHVKAALLGCRI